MKLSDGELEVPPYLRDKQVILCNTMVVLLGELDRLRGVWREEYGCDPGAPTLVEIAQVSGQLSLVTRDVAAMTAKLSVAVQPKPTLVRAERRARWGL